VEVYSLSYKVNQDHQNLLHVIYDNVNMTRQHDRSTEDLMLKAESIVYT